MIWDFMLELKQKMKEVNKNHSFISAELSDTSEFILFDQKRSDKSITISFNDDSKDTLHHIVSVSPFCIKICDDTIFDEDQKSILEAYLPYVLLPYYAKTQNKCFAITHFAQTLDGRIASFSGDSKWIGNEENLLHAHKMRALCDAILVGANTLKIDNPRLNVRLVKGNNPIRVIIGGDDLAISDYHAFDKSTISFCQNHEETDGSIRKVKLHKKGDEYDLDEVLINLCEMGIYSVYVEGGAYTTSCFLRQRKADQVQVHITPKILGSGRTGIEFSGIDNMSQALDFAKFRFVPMGDHMMFVGELNER